MASNLVPQHGTDKRGNPYTRMVKRAKVSVPRATPKPNKGNKHTNQSYANRFLGVDSLEKRNSDSLDFHEVSVGDTIRMLNKVAHDSLGRSLNIDELRTAINEHLWDSSEDYDDTQEQGWDRADFHDVSVWGINAAINEVRLLAN